MRAEAEGKDPHEAVAAANAEGEAGDATEGEAPAEAAVDPVDDAPAEAAVDPVDDAPAEETVEAEPAEPQGVPSFDDEPQEVIDTEGATAESHEAPAAVYGGAATAPVAPAHEGALPLVDGAGEDPGATVAMPAMPQE